MSPAFPTSAGRAVLLVALVALVLGACGRRGALEAPPDPQAVAATRGGTATGEDVTDDGEPTAPGTGGFASPTPRKRSRALTIPTEPFVLDPLL